MPKHRQLIELDVCKVYKQRLAVVQLTCTAHISCCLTLLESGTGESQRNLRNALGFPCDLSLHYILLNSGSCPAVLALCGITLKVSKTVSN